MDIVETYFLYFYRDSKYSSWSFTTIILIWDPIDFSCAHDWHFNNTFLSCCHFNNTFSGSSKHMLGIQVFRRASVGSFTPRNSNSPPFCQSQTPARVICPGPSSASESQVSAPPISQTQPWSTLLQWVDLCAVWLSSLDVHDIGVRPSLPTCLAGDETSASCCWVLQATPPSFHFPRLRFVRSCACVPRKEPSGWLVVWMPYLLKGH